MTAAANLEKVRNAPFRPADFMPVDLDVRDVGGGTLVVKSRIPLAEHERVLPRIVTAQAKALGDKAFLMQRLGPERAWVMQTYAETKQRTDAVAQWLLNRNIGADRSILILSGNSIAHANISYGGFAAGVPICPVSVNYGLAKADFGRLTHVVKLVKPAVIFAENAAPFLAALQNVDFGDAVIVTATPELLGAKAVGWADVLATPVTSAVEQRIAALKPDSIAAYMLTSGSTGRPKAVVQTHLMKAANICQAIQTMGKVAGWEGMILDWLPWSHVSGASGLMMSLVAGGTFRIDDGKPLPGMFDESLRNLREVSLRYYVNMPIGYAILVDALEADEALRKTFFKDLTIMLYGGAGLPQPILDRLQVMAVAETGHRILGISAYGSTETTSGCLSIHYPTEKVGIGLPMPGIEVKLVPHGPRYEVRIRGPLITPGYLHEPEKNREILDEDGFYKTGDYATFIEDGDLTKGLAFAGRLAEEFKLTSGTWVRSGELRMDLIKALAPYVSELVVCAEGRAHLTAMLWLNKAAIAADKKSEADINAFIQERLAAHNKAHPGLSSRIHRALILQEPPAVEAHEISDKGSVNRNMVLQRRADQLEKLYQNPPPADVIVIS
ncbi:MAG: AMP-binding protein [Rhodospirillaceae bacterium]|nr:AMP-binding protein [Rhodospirillaceae bacterium]